MPFPLTHGTKMYTKCSHCGTQLRRIEINPNSDGSPFQKSAALIVCDHCDGPGRLPFEKDA